MLPSDLLFLHLALHDFSERAVDASLIPASLFLEPGQDIGIQSQRHWFLQRAVQICNLHVLQRKWLLFEPLAGGRLVHTRAPSASRTGIRAFCAIGGTPHPRGMPANSRFILCESLSPRH